MLLLLPIGADGTLSGEVKETKKRGVWRDAWWPGVARGDPVGPGGIYGIYDIYGIFGIF